MISATVRMMSQVVLFPKLTVPFETESCENVNQSTYLPGGALSQVDADMMEAVHPVSFAAACCRILGSVLAL